MSQSFVKKICMIFYLLLVSSCSFNDFKPKEYVEFVTDVDNGMRKTQSMNLVYYDIQYWPREYKAILESRGNYNKIKFQNHLSRFENGLFYTMRVVDSSVIKNKSKDEQNIEIDVTESKFSEINFWMEPKLFLIIGDDTLRCKLSHLEPLNKKNPVFNFSLVFEGSELYLQKHMNDSILFVFQDDVWNNQTIFASNTIATILNRPNVKL